MPLKTQKIDTADALTLEWILHVKKYKLSLNKAHCVGCQICSLACPKEAITLTKQPTTDGVKTKHAKVDVDLSKCNFCGICDVVCPYGAIRVTVDGHHSVNVLAKESFPELIRDIKVDTRLCPAECTECGNACPLDLIFLSKSFEGRPIEDVNVLRSDQKERVKTNLVIKKEFCPTCKVCEYKCPPDIIKVRKTYEGNIAIDQAKCPEGCKNCLDVCPITGALTMSESNGKVQANESVCVYCGACKAVCPVDQALSVKRTKVLHTPVHSGAWNKTLERLTSTTDTAKELKAKGLQKAKETVSRRFVAEEDIR
jgi:4Fe-4S ferredoxin